MEIEWHADEEKGERISYSIEEIKKSLFDSYKESAWCLYFDMRWNNKLLQSKHEAVHNDDTEE